jgi:hypothetical protein
LFEVRDMHGLQTQMRFLYRGKPQGRKLRSIPTDPFWQKCPKKSGAK